MTDRDDKPKKGLPPGTTVAEYMEHYLPRALNKNAEKLGDVECELLFALTGAGGGDWTLVVKERVARVEPGRGEAPRCTFTMTAVDWMELVQGRLNGPLAFMTGRFKIGGDYLYAMRLGQMLMAALPKK